MDKLKPCPFCGAEAEVIIHPYTVQIDVFGVECTRCGCKTEQNYTSKIGAIGAWNRRVSENGET